MIDSLKETLNLVGIMLSWLTGNKAERSFIVSKTLWTCKLLPVKERWHHQHLFKKVRHFQPEALWVAVRKRWNAQKKVTRCSTSTLGGRLQQHTLASHYRYIKEYILKNTHRDTMLLRKNTMLTPAHTLCNEVIVGWLRKTVLMKCIVSF